MKMALAAVFVVAVSGAAFARSHSTGYDNPYGGYTNPNTERVSGYERKDGTYVAPYERTEANNTRDDNFSTRGNENPYTGKTGYGKTDSDYNNGSTYNPYGR